MLIFNSYAEFTRVKVSMRLHLVIQLVGVPCVRHIFLHTVLWVQLSVYFIWSLHVTVIQMRQALVIRLSAAEKVIEEAEREKQEEEGSALEALALQERIMEEVVQESRLLKEEAEENSKVVIAWLSELY